MPLLSTFLSSLFLWGGVPGIKASHTSHQRSTTESHLQPYPCISNHFYPATLLSRVNPCKGTHGVVLGCPLPAEVAFHILRGQEMTKQQRNGRGEGVTW